MTARKNLTDEQIDEAVIAQADDENAWNAPVHVGAYDRELLLRMPVDLLRRMNLQARKDGFAHVEDWVMHLLVVNLQPVPNSPAIKEAPANYGPKKKKSDN